MLCRCDSAESSAESSVESEVSDDVGFLQDIAQRCWWIAMMQFSMICLVFFLAMWQFSHLACVLIVVETLISMMLQLRSKAQIVTWIQSKEDWQKHKTSMDAEFVHIFPMVFKFLGCVVEALDPSMDAWTAANAQSMCHPSLCSKFEKAWQPIPVARDVVVWLGGLPGILLFLLVASSVVQLAELSTKDRQLRNSLEEMRLFSPDPDTAAHTRWRVWIYFSHMADVGGVMLLQDLFLKLVEVEISLSSQIWPVADRNAAFRSKIMLEALPALWLQISLLNLTLDTASSLSIAVTCFSIAFSFYNILKHLGLVFQALLPGLGMIEINSYRGSSCYNAQLASMFGFALCILLACIIRLFGTLLCPSHILNITTGCVQL